MECKNHISFDFHFAKHLQVTIKNILREGHKECNQIIFYKPMLTMGEREDGKALNSLKNNCRVVKSKKAVNTIIFVLIIAL